MKLTEVLLRLYHGHWYPGHPSRASGYRCISCDSSLDPSLRNAARMAGIDESVLTESLPGVFSIWIDPMDVSYRIGERGHVVCVWSDGADHYDLRERTPIANSRLPLLCPPIHRERNSPSRGPFAPTYSASVPINNDIYHHVTNEEYTYPGDCNTGSRGTDDSSIGSGSSSPSASPILSEEDDCSYPDDSLNTQLAQSNPFTPLGTPTRKVSILSRAAPEFSPRSIPLPPSAGSQHGWGSVC